MVRILIISDIHLWSLPNEHDQFYPIRRKLLEDIKDYTAAKGQISHILISGDIAARVLKMSINKPHNSSMSFAKKRIVQNMRFI